MSLIYDALMQQAGVADAGRPLPRASWWHRLPSRGRGALLLCLGAALSMPLYLIASGPDMPGGDRNAPAGARAADPTPVDVAPPAAAGPTRTPAMQEATVRPVPAPALPSAPADILAAAPVTSAAEPSVDVRSMAPSIEAAPAVAHDTAHRAVAGTPAHGAVADPAPASAPVRITVEQRAGAPGTSGPTHDDGAIQRAIAAVETAVADGDFSAAGQALAGLDGLLPTGSLTLLRMRAWVAHGSGAMGEAEGLYRQIIQRVPDDENAGVNIAMLDARRGELDDARARLMGLSGRTSRSPLVERALAELDGMTR